MNRSALTLDDSIRVGLTRLDDLYRESEAAKPLWPSPYDELTPEAAYRWLTECWWTENEADGKVALVPKKEFIRLFTKEWVESYIAKRPMWTEKSRRLVISWASRGLETWAMGLRKGSWLIVDQTDENAGEHLWRVHFCLEKLYDRRQDLKLRPHRAMGSVDKHNVSDVILPNGSWLTQTHQDAGASQGKGKTGITLEELSKYRAPTAFVGQAVIVTQGEGESPGGWVNGIANASPNPDWHSIKPDGKGSDGKSQHVKATELLENPDALQMTGFAAKDLSNGHRYLVIHYTADDAKRGGWRNQKSEGVPPREWDREMELNEDLHSGKPAYETYDDDRHCPKRFRGTERIPIVNGSTFIAGWDCGSTMRPGFVLLQITPSPAFQVHCVLEVTSEGNEPMSMFAPRVFKEIQAKLPFHWSDVIHVGDGTIQNSMGNDGRSAAEIARKTLGVLIKPMSNIESIRQSAVTDLLMGQIAKGDGAANRFVLDGGCSMVRSGFNGGYKYGEIKLSDGSTIPTDKPLKNRYADPHDALQYAAQEAWRQIEGRSGGKVHRRHL